MRYLALVAALTMFAMPASGQMAGQLCSSTVAMRAGCGVMAGVNILYRSTDSVDATDCTTGGGSAEVVCLCEGTTCLVVADDAGPGAIGGNDDFFENTPDGAMTLTIDEASPATITCADDSGACDMTLDAGTTGAIIVGSADVTNITLNSDVGVTFANNSDSVNNLADATFDFTRDDTGAVTLTCSDDDATCAMVYDAGGAAAITVGSADVTSISLVTDGGTVTVDGTVVGKMSVVSLASGALTLNTVHLATAAADYDIPDLACDAAADIGNWVTVIIEDASTVISITSDDASNIITVPGLGLGAGDELDSVSTAAHEGQSITLVCITAENWYSINTDLTSGGAIAWADGGVAD